MQCHEVGLYWKRSELSMIMVFWSHWIFWFRLMAYLIMELDLTSNILTSFGSGNTDSFVRWHPSCCRLSQRPEKDQSLCPSTALFTTNSFWRGTCQELSKQLPYTRLARSFFLTLLSDSRFGLMCLLDVWLRRVRKHFFNSFLLAVRIKAFLFLYVVFSKR